jgi:hypothetical protein
MLRITRNKILEIKCVIKGGLRMIYRFRIDLGNGDYSDIGVDSKKEYTLNDLLNEIQSCKEYVIFNNSAIQKCHIKRIEMLNN